MDESSSKYLQYGSGRLTNGLTLVFNITLQTGKME